MGKKGSLVVSRIRKMQLNFYCQPPGNLTQKMLPTFNFIIQYDDYRLISGLKVLQICAGILPWGVFLFDKFDI